MKIVVGKIILSDKYIFIPAVIAVLVAIFIMITLISAGNLEKKNKKLKGQLQEMLTQREELIDIRNIVESKEKKIGLTKVSGIVPTMEQILNSIGLTAKTIRPLEKNKIKEFTEENAELEVEDIDLNKIVNLFYKFENSPVPIKIKSVHMKTTFENQNKFTLNMTASLIRR